MTEYVSVLPSLSALKNGSKVVHGTFATAKHPTMALCGAMTHGDPGDAEITCKRCLRVIHPKQKSLSNIKQKELATYTQIAAAFRAVIERPIRQTAPREAMRVEAQRHFGKLPRSAYIAYGFNYYGERMFFVQKDGEDTAMLWHSDDLLRDEILTVVDGKVTPDIIVNEGERLFISACWEASTPWR